MDSAGTLFSHRATSRVTYRMTDQMGVVYYAHYMELFEIGRTELLRAAGLAYRQMEQDGFYLPVIHAACDYLAPARYDDLLEIETLLCRLTRVRIDFQYQVLRQVDQACLATGLTRHAVVGPDGHPRRLGAAWMERLSAKGR